MTVGQRDEFAEAWSRHKRASDTPSVTEDRPTKKVKAEEISAGASATATDDQHPLTPQAKPKAKVKAKTGTKTFKGKGDDGPETTSAKEVMMKATKARKEYQETMGSATTVLRAIDTSDEWNWAKSTSLEKALRGAFQELSQGLTTFATDFLMSGVQSMKLRMGPEEFTVELNKFLLEVEPRVDKVRTQVSRLTEMHHISRRY